MENKILLVSARSYGLNPCLYFVLTFSYPTINIRFVSVLDCVEQWFLSWTAVFNLVLIHSYLCLLPGYFTYLRRLQTPSLSGTEYGVLRFYSDNTALMYYVTNCFFSYHFLSKPMKEYIIITDIVSIETWIISPVDVNYHILSLLLPFMVAFFSLFYAVLKPLTFHHTAHSILSNSPDMHVHTCVSIWYDICKGLL